jgi:hypothetical protein
MKTLLQFINLNVIFIYFLTVRGCDRQILTKYSQIVVRKMKMREGYTQSKTFGIEEVRLIY